MRRIELHAKTKYSKDHESTIDIKELILKCVENKEKGVGIVDSGSIVSFLKAEKVLKELNIKDFKIVYGVELDTYYKDDIYKVIVLVKNKKGISSLYKELNVYNNHKKIPLSWLLKLKDNFILGLVYDSNKYNYEIIKYMDYIEVDSKVEKEDIALLKEEKCVIYSNRINALSNEEELPKKIIYDKLRIKKEINNRIYKNTDEIMFEIDDREIVIDNTNYIFDMIEKFDILDDEMILPDNKYLDLDLVIKEKLYEKYKDDVPKNVSNRINEELNLIHKYNYEGYLNIYKKIVDKYKELNEEYMICDYISYLYIAYLLDITHFDPLKYDLNSDLFFSNYPKIIIKCSENIISKINDYIKNDLEINTIYCKSNMKLNGYMLNRTIDKYEEKNNINFSLDEKSLIAKYLDNYPLNNHFMTTKQMIISNIDLYTPKVILSDREYTNIDYKDIEHKFMTIELLGYEKIDKLNRYKKININYNDKKIINKKEFKDYIKKYENNLILDDLYEELVINLDLVDVFNIINEIRENKVVSKKTKDILEKNNIKLKKYHNISFISRGILNEISRVEYELLYLKEYSKNTSIIGTRPLNGKMPYIGNLIHTLLKDNKKVLIFGLNGTSNYYLEYILSNITGIDRKILHKYLNPYLSFDNVEEVDENLYMEGIKYLLSKKVLIIDSYIINNIIIENSKNILDKMIYMINDSNSDVVIIDGSNYIDNNVEKTLKKISEIKDVDFIIFDSLKREYESINKKDVSMFENYNILKKYSDSISILDGTNIYEVNE